MRKVCILFLALFCLIFPNVSHAQEQEEIRSYDTEVDIHADGSIQVTERIEYFFDSPRHGIFRDIPVVKTNEDGKKYQIALKDISVTDEKGKAYTFVESQVGDSIQLKIGDADRTITGLHMYVVSYTALGALTYFPGHDELYWNSVGTAWEVPIQTATMTVRMPKDSPPEELHVDCFVGEQGETGKDCLITTPDDHSVKVLLTRPLEPYEGIAAVVAFPKGLVAVLEPKELVPFFSTLIGKIIFALIMIVAFLWYIVAPFIVIRKWWKYGRDPKPAMGEVSAWFSPPKTEKHRALTPAETGALVDESADLRDLYGTFVDLARRGYMKIIETKKGVFDLSRQKDWKGDPDLQPFERTLLTELFKKDDLVSMKDMQLFTTFEEMKKQIYESLVADGFFAQNPNTVRMKYYGLAGIALVTGNLILFLVASLFGKNMPRKTLFGAQQAAMAFSLKNFLMSQDKKLKFQAEKQMMFEKLLPYAVAFGVEEIWAKRFEKLGIKQPDWYVTSSGGHFNSVVFAQSIGSAQHVSFAASVSSRSSSGFSSGFSGGSSGGGGGGGGGGSW